MQHKRLIPFRLLPASWGLLGSAYDEAEAYYLYSGEHLERRLAEIALRDRPRQLTETLLGLDLSYGRISGYEHDLRCLALHGRADDVQAIATIELTHGRISQYEYDVRLIKASGMADPAQARALLDVEHRHGKISKSAYDKAAADLDEKPWIGIVDQGFDMEKGVNGVYFEFDWNPFWVEYLRLNGYVGHSEEAIVERWFEDVCRATAAASAGEVASVAVAPLTSTVRASTRLRGTDGTFYS